MINEDLFRRPCIMTEKTLEILPIRQALLLTEKEALTEQVQLRQKLAKGCVGTLYPSVLIHEIQRLENRISKVASDVS